MAAITPRVAAAIERTKAEITDDMAFGIVSTEVRSFSELHDFVDANTYGGICDADGTWDDVGTDQGLEAINDVQDAVDQWLKDGGPDAVVLEGGTTLAMVVMSDRNGDEHADDCAFTNSTTFASCNCSGR
jgi:hypothetical protein